MSVTYSSGDSGVTEPEQFWYVDTEKFAGFVLATGPYEAFKFFVRSAEKSAVGVRVYDTEVFEQILHGHGDAVWSEHPEGDPYRSELNKFDLGLSDDYKGDEDN